MFFSYIRCNTGGVDFEDGNRPGSVTALRPGNVAFVPLSIARDAITAKLAAPVAAKTKFIAGGAMFNSDGDTCVAAAPVKPVMAAGFDDGTLWAANLKTGKLEKLKSDKGPPITAVAVAADASAVAFGDEAGGAWIMPLRDF